MSIQDINGGEARVAWFGGTELHDDYFPLCCLTRKAWIGDQD